MLLRLRLTALRGAPLRSALLARPTLLMVARSSHRFSQAARRRLSDVPTARPQPQPTVSAQDEARAKALQEMAFEQEAAEGPGTLRTIMLWAGFLTIAGFAGYVAVNELMPGKMSPTTVFHNAFEEVRNHSEVVARLGTPISGYGRDLGGTREGRRNFYEHDQYVDDDGVNRTRIKFNVEGPLGKAVVYAEQKAGTSSKEFTYIILEHATRGRRDVIALQDNRKALTLAEKQEKVATRLTKAGVVLMGASDPWTRKQLEEFGEYKDKIKVIMCDQPENHDVCANAQLKGEACCFSVARARPGTDQRARTGFPTWRVKDQNLGGGYKPLEELQAIARML